MQKGFFNMNNDYWRVNSYGYPNPFSNDRKSIQSWDTFTSFLDFSSYSKLKGFWASTNAPRRLSAHSVESWKATFEEFGLLYVLRGSDEIRITPAGYQFRNAADDKRINEFGWIGISLLLRYPLRGSRKPKTELHGESNILLYWFLFAAMRELQNYFWWSELERILCKVFRTEEAENAISDVLKMRRGEISLDDYPLPINRMSNRGGFYNSLNQVIVHAGMNYLLLATNIDDSFYSKVDKERRQWILNDWLPIVDLALGGSIINSACEDKSAFVSRMPQAPNFAGDELAYFEYMGAEVLAMPNLLSEASIPYGSIGEVSVLKVDVHYSIRGPQEIVGSIGTLCRLAKGQRVILSHSLSHTYIIEDKTRLRFDDVSVKIRRARPITNIQPILSLLEDMHG